MEAQAAALFAEHFGGDGRSDTACVSAAGRVNLIGEHVDYQDGFVLPMALTLKTVCVARRNPFNSDRCRIISGAVSGEIGVIEFGMDSEESIVPGRDSTWAKYVKGVVKHYASEISAAESAKSVEEDFAVGFDAAFVSDVPIGGGLSSSASLEVCTAMMLEQLYEIASVSKKERALRCVEAEHSFAGVPCGIMDQFISSCAVEGCALLIDCRSKETKEIQFSDKNLRIVVTNSNKNHELSGSEYPDRVRQCKEATAAIADELKGDGKSRTHLRDCTLEELEQVKSKGKIDEIAYKRARHVISEISRTQFAAEAAESRNYAVFGELMKESHYSLRDDFEVSTPEIDFLVQLANQQIGVHGSRITGGGFGGCIITLVEAALVNGLLNSFKRKYKEQFGIDCTSYVTVPGSGPQLHWHNNRIGSEEPNTKKQKL